MHVLPFSALHLTTISSWTTHHMFSHQQLGEHYVYHIHENISYNCPDKWWPTNVTLAHLTTAERTCMKRAHTTSPARKITSSPHLPGQPVPIVRTAVPNRNMTWQYFSNPVHRPNHTGQDRGHNHRLEGGRLKRLSVNCRVSRELMI